LDSSSTVASEHVKAFTLTGDCFALAIVDNFTFAGRPDTIGIGMAIVMDADLAKALVRTALNSVPAITSIVTSR
jgi:hypothetical protein